MPTFISPETWQTGGVYVLSAPGEESVGRHALRRMLERNTCMPSGEDAGEHFAFLLRPGSHADGIHVGYYCTVHGLGRDPSQTTAPVFCLGALDQNGSHCGALDTFWRSAENLTLLPPAPFPPGLAPEKLYYDICSAANGVASFGPPGSAASDRMPLPCPTWSVSQACSLRQIRVQGDLWFDNVSPCSSRNPDGSIPALYASGGFAADLACSGRLNLMGQQQFCFLRCQASGIEGGAWNTVSVDDAGLSELGSAALQSRVSSCEWGLAEACAVKRPHLIEIEGDSYAIQTERGLIDTFAFVTTFEGLRNALEQGSPTIVLASSTAILVPESLRVHVPGTLILGLGFPNLCLQQPFLVEAEGVQLCGLLFSCAFQEPELSLLQWTLSGSASSQGPQPSSLGRLVDCACRVGGPGVSDASQVSCCALCEVRQGRVHLENVHFWRADHGAAPLTGARDNNYCRYGLWVSPAALVSAVGLASEHSLDTPCLWEGPHGRVVFYQCELPYEVVDQPPPGMVITGPDFACLGAGVYCFFRDLSRSGLWASAGVHAKTPDARFYNLCTVWLNGCADTGIRTVLLDSNGQNHGAAAQMSTRGQAIKLDSDP